MPHPFLLLICYFCWCKESCLSDSTNDTKFDMCVKLGVIRGVKVGPEFQGHGVGLDLNIFYPYHEPIEFLPHRAKCLFVLKQKQNVSVFLNSINRTQHVAMISTKINS